MSNPQILKLVSKLNDSPEVIGRFRKVVVGLAIAGKFRARDKGDLEIDEILRALDDSSEEAAGQGPLRRHHKQSRARTLVLPAGIVESDRFVPLGKVARIEKGKTGIKNALPGSFPLVVTAAQRLTSDHFDFDGAATIVPLVSSTGHGNASLHRLHYQEGKFALGSILAAVFPAKPEVFSARFLFEYLSTFKDELLVSQMIGTANVTLSIEKIANVGIPVIPYSVQSKVDDLMMLCDQLEQVREERESKRDKLTAATLARLNIPNPGSLRTDARFALENFRALTTRIDQIKQLRESILNLAVQGRLSEQKASDEPASILLAQIRSAKDVLGLPHVSSEQREENMPFNLPAGWAWTDIGEISSKTGSGSTPRGGKGAYKKTGVPFLRSQNVYNEGLRLADVAFIDQQTHKRMAGTAVLPSDLLLNITGGSIGRCCHVPDEFGEANVSQHVAIIRCAVPGVSDFLHRLVLSPYFQAFIFDEQTGAGRGGLPKNRMDRIAVALPPLQEQKRIVAKVYELMTLCDQLEKSLASSEEVRSRLLRALLVDVLQSAKGHLAEDDQLGSRSIKLAS